jgi:HTH-type transcriptional regulator/antitoxin HigA
MKIKAIKSELDYKNAVSLLEEIGDKPNFENDQNLIDQFEVLETLIEAYESFNYSIEDGDPIEVIKLKMAYMNLAQKDLIPFVGSKGVVSEVMNKKRGLSKLMIRNLSEYLNISQELLNIKYELNLVKKDSVITGVNSHRKTALKFLTPNGIDTLFITNRIRTRGVTFAMYS